jgi:hypothetical protein
MGQEAAGAPVNLIYLNLAGHEHEKVRSQPGPVGIGADLEKNR